MTLAHVIEYGERQWKDICDNQFNQLSEGKILNLKAAKNYQSW